MKLSAFPFLAAVALFLSVFLVRAEPRADATASISVPAIVCEGCAKSIETACRNNKEIGGVYVDVKKKVVLVEGIDGRPVPDEVLQKVLKKAGYDAKEIRRVPGSLADAKAALASS